MRSVKVRFHLGAGEHHSKFQVIDDAGSKTYYDPKKVQLRMRNAVLHNRPKIAARIFAGEINKTVCSWIRCDHVEVLPSNGETGVSQVEYNPRKAPYWVEAGVNVDFEQYEVLITNDRKVYMCESPTTK